MEGTENVVKIDPTSQDILWKSRVATEIMRAKIWESRWGFMKMGMKEVLGSDIDSLIDNDRPKAPSLECMKVRKATPISSYLKPVPSPSPYPKTTSSLIGWRSRHPACLLDKYGATENKKGDFLKRMNWPTECLP